jgi:hypothetical protein
MVQIIIIVLHVSKTHLELVNPAFVKMDFSKWVNYNAQVIKYQKIKQICNNDFA